MQDYCFSAVCFYRLPSGGPSIFGFGEFLAALALMVLAWTIADARYRFRIATAFIPLNGFTFWVVTGVGILTLATDLWHAERWYVPRGNIISSSQWQVLLGGVFLGTFLMWAWFAFVRPQRFGKRNATRYARAVYRTILKGDATELAIVADELSYSAEALITASREFDRFRPKDDLPLSNLEKCSQHILLLIADRRFCKVIVATSPGTIMAIFKAVEATEKYQVPLRTFGTNIINEAIINQDSFIYHENEGYLNGLMGYHKPLTQAIFANYAIADSQESLLDPDLRSKTRWDATHWEAYGRLVLMTVRSYLAQRGPHEHSYILHRALSNISRACVDLYSLNGQDGSTYEDDRTARLRVCVNVIRRSIEALEGKEDGIRRRIRDDRHFHTIFDLLADCVLDIIKEASAVQTPRWTAWFIQYNYVWGELFNFNRLDGKAASIVKFKIRRKLYDEILNLESFSYFQSARILGMLLNVMGLDASDRRYNDDTRALHIAILSWTRKNFLRLNKTDPKLAQACLCEGVELDEKNSRLVRSDGLVPTENQRFVYLDLVPIDEVTTDSRAPSRLQANQ